MACMCLLTDGHSTRGSHSFFKYEANAGMDIKAVALYDSSSSLKRLIWNNITHKKNPLFQPTFRGGGVPELCT
jgi:hypothetical protein